MNNQLTYLKLHFDKVTYLGELEDNTIIFEIYDTYNNFTFVGYLNNKFFSLAVNDGFLIEQDVLDKLTSEYEKYHGPIELGLL